MKLIVKLLKGDLLEIDWDPSTGEKGLKSSIQSFDPSWTPGRQQLFMIEPTRFPFDIKDLSEGDCIGLFLCPLQFAKITSSYTHTLFALHLSSEQDFSYPNTLSVFFEFERKNGEDEFRCFITRKIFNTLEEIIKNMPYITQEMKPYWIEIALPAWEEVMKWWPSLRQAYLDRRARIQDGIH
jgi:hypothetical protein